MSEPRIGRVLVASLHQAIADVLPMRLEFYENWLNATGLRDGTIGLAALSAVLSFLRAEGQPYEQITTKAGEYAAEWTVRGLPGMERRLIAALPAPLRLRAALRTARSLVRATYPGSRAIVRVRRGSAEIDLRGSLFCEVRTASPLPLCGFYASAIARVLRLLSVNAEAQVLACRASGASRGCTLTIASGRQTEPEVEWPEHAA
jgi:bacteriochlorophyll 4-vinyl reductase